MPPLLPSADTRSRYLLDWSAAACLFAPEQSLDATTGQPTSFARPTSTTATDARGASRYIPADTPAFQWVYDPVPNQMAPGLKVTTDAVSLPAVDISGTIYRRYYDQAAAFMRESVYVYTAGDAIRFFRDCVHLAVKVARGTVSLATMRGSTIGPVVSIPATEVPFVQISAGVYQYTAGVAAYELADLGGTGNYTLIAPGASPGATRLRVYQSGSNLIGV